MTDKVIAQLTFAMVDLIIMNGNRSDENYKPFIRLKDLKLNEIVQFLALWKEQENQPHLKDIKVVVPYDSDGTYPAEFVSAPDTPITNHRNYNTSGLIYIETTMQTDAQGLAELFTIRDKDYLEGTYSSEFKAKAKLCQICWDEVIGSKFNLPDQLKTLIERISLLVPDISIRSFAAFVITVCEQVKNTPPFSHDKLVLLIGHAITQFGFFPDCSLFAVDNNSSLKTRLTKNFHISQLSKANGEDVERDDLLEKLENIWFYDLEENNYSEEENNRLRSLCGEYIETRSNDARLEIQFHIFIQLFENRSDNLPLGELVEAEIRAHDSIRVDEYIDLEVKEGLSQGENNAAIKFLEAEPPDGSDENIETLANIIRKVTRKKIERIAYPQKISFDNPLLQIIQIIQESQYYEVQGDLILEVNTGRISERHQPSISLFAFQYSQILRELVRDTEGLPESINLKIADVLLNITPAPEIPQTDDEEEEEREIEWLPIPFVFRVKQVVNDQETILDEIDIYRWYPKDIAWHAFSWLMISASDRPTLNSSLTIGNNLSIDDVITEAIQRTIPLTSLLHSDPFSTDVCQDKILSGFLSCREILHNKLSVMGVSIDTISDYFDDWENTHLKNSREVFVPDGSISEKIFTLISSDIIWHGNGQEAVMLASHPFRLRWLARYLGELKRLTFDSLTKTLRLNKENETYYLNYLKKLSPHQHPPLLANNKRTLMLPISEKGGCEHFASIKEGGSLATHWTSSTDDESSNEIAKTICSYVEAHPYKVDGLCISIVLPDGGNLPIKLIAQVKLIYKKPLSYSFFIFTPKYKIQSITDLFETLETTSRMEEDESLRPPIQLSVFPWEGTEKDCSLLEGITSDLVIIPNYFSERIEINESTEVSDDSRSSFNVLYDKTSHAQTEIKSSSVSICLKPLEIDSAIENWSTLNVRLLKTIPVSPSEPSNVDYIQMLVRVEDASNIFTAAHKSGHWVVTLDPYIGRKQIESLPNKPDILVVKERVGKNGLYTLVTSSNAGKEFVTQRLKRKITPLLSQEHKHISSKLAESVYREVRDISPGLIMKSMGLSRVTEEVLGLKIAKNCAGQHFPSLQTNYILKWFSLDEHSDWFGGDSGVRADLCRVVLYFSEDRLKVELLVVEGKLRQSFDRHGIKQVEKTINLFKSAFSGSISDKDFVDKTCWRHELVSALESLLPEATEHYGSYASLDKNKLPADIKDLIKAGEYDLSECKGLFSNCLYIRGAGKAEDRGDVKIVHSCASDLLQLVDDEVIDGIKPAAPEPAAPEPAAPEPAAPPESEQSRGLDEKTLLDRYQIILNTYREFNVDVCSAGNLSNCIQEGPASIRFRVIPGAGVLPKKLSDIKDALKLKLNLPEEAELRFINDMGAVSIVAPKKNNERYFVNAKSMWQQWGEPEPGTLSVPIGENETGEIVSIDFSSTNSPHLLIGGTTGSGKSEALNTILYGLTHYYNETELRLILIDPKRTELGSFSEMPHTMGSIGYDENDAIQILNEAIGEMERRYQLFHESKPIKALPEYNKSVEGDHKLPRWLLVLDEYADLVSDPDAKRTIQNCLQRLAQKARACGIHVIVATQKPTHSIISTVVRSNLPAQLALRTRDSTDSKIIMDATGAETLNGKGDAFLNIGNKLQRVQCAFFSD